MSGITGWAVRTTTASQIDLADGHVWGSDPNPAPDDISCVFAQDMTIADWFGRWLEGTLYQPWLVEDATTRKWRGATDAEYVAASSGIEEDDD